MGGHRIQDIADRAMQSAGDKFRSILEDAPLGVYQASADGGIVYANTAFVRMLGYSDLDGLIRASGDPLRGMYCSSEDMDAHLHRIRTEPDGAVAEMCLSCADGGFFWASVQTRTVADEAGEPLYHDGFVIDITEKKALQAEAVRASQLASLGELAAGVAHEINNPLNAVINFAQLLEEDLPEGTQQADLLARIVRESNRIAVIVRNLLSFAREKSRSSGPLHLRRVVEDSLGLTRAQMEKEGIWIEADIPDDLPELVGRAQELQQVFINLLSNARHALNEKFTGQDPEKIVRITAEPAEMHGNRVVRIRVRDNGVGIQPEMLERVTDPFFSTKPEGVGTGLGLSISRKIVESHSGTLTISSEPDSFTEIIVTLPVGPEEHHGENSGRG